MKYILVIIFVFIGMTNYAQTVLTIQGQTYTNSADTWLGVNIPRSAPTKFTFSNNLITSINTVGYQLQAGDETAGSTNHNLDGALITGNKLSWSGTNMTCITHGLFTGHNSNVIIKYNYLNYVPMGIIRKSTNNMSNTTGGVAYNIVKGGAVAVVVKGMSNVNIYNNTLYTDRTPSQTWRPLVHIYTNTDITPYSVSHNTKIYNNIFYTKYQTLDITVEDAESLTGLECDYNVYWCENGVPAFSVNGSVKTFAQWQAMGYDKHSVVINPDFKDLIKFVPASRLNYGISLDASWANGLSPSAEWGTTDPQTIAQNGLWQVGAVVYPSSSGSTDSIPQYLSAVVQNPTPYRLEIDLDKPLDPSKLPDTSAFIVIINSNRVKIQKVEISGSSVFLTLSVKVVVDDVITVAYKKPSVNMLQTSSGIMADAFPAQPVTNNCLRSGSGNTFISVYPNPARNFINISNLESSPDPYIIRIIDCEGKLCSESTLNPDNNTPIPLKLSGGLYFVQVLSGSASMFVQKLVIVE